VFPNQIFVVSGQIRCSGRQFIARGGEGKAAIRSILPPSFSFFKCGIHWKRVNWHSGRSDIFIIMLGRTEERNKIGDHFDLQR